VSRGWAELATAVTSVAPAGVPIDSHRPVQSRDRTATLADGRLVTSSTPTLSPREALGLPAVYAAVGLITATVDQLPLRHHLGESDDGQPLPEWLRHPDRYGSDYTLADMVEYWTTSQALRGAAYAWAAPVGEQSWRLDPIDPHDVSVELPTTDPRARRVYRMAGRTVPTVAVYPWDRRQAGLLTMPLLVVPGQAAGVGPIQAARTAMAGYRDVDDYANQMFGAGRGYSGQALVTDQDIDEQTAEHYQAKVIERSTDPLAPPLVLGNGLTWQSLTLPPKDAQWLESRLFNAQEVCRMYGVPPRYLGLPSGDATTYATARDNDAQLLRTAVSRYTNTIAHGLTRLMPAGRGPDEEQHIRFDFGAWLGPPDQAAPPATDTEGDQGAPLRD